MCILGNQPLWRVKYDSMFNGVELHGCFFVGSVSLPQVTTLY
jgi:hypothetical protein